MFIWAIVIILAAWLIIKYSNKSEITDTVNIVTEDNEPISEEKVFEIQNNFEKKLEETYLPDSLSGEEIYTYRNLMRKWFYELSGKYRYNQEMIQKIRRDFLDYMYSAEHGKTASFLSFELEDKSSQEEYEKEARISGKKAYSIENAFASLIGKGAEEELASVRNRAYQDFSRKGDLAPEGQHFDLEGNLKRNKK